MVKKSLNIFMTIIVLLIFINSASAVNYLTFTAEMDSCSFAIKMKDYLTNNPTVQYSLNDGNTWEPMVNDIFVNLRKKGDKALLRGYNFQGISNSMFGDMSFVMKGRIAAGGSVMSLIDGKGDCDEIPNGYCFSGLFSNCESLTCPPQLTATKLTKGCYSWMFYKCTNLVQAPELPAMKLAEDCYGQMFDGCSSLISAPELPATELKEKCYRGMFSNCISMTHAPKLPAMVMAKKCYCSMFAGCTNLKHASHLPSVTLAEACYEWMFSDCVNLVEAPELPSVKLSRECYSGMFAGCVNLTHGPQLPATSLEVQCYRWMFVKCINMQEAPVLPAKDLDIGCYYGMFLGCLNLSYVKVEFEDWGEFIEGWNLWNTDKWLKGVAKSGIFVCSKKLKRKKGVNWIPRGWLIRENENE